MHQYEGQHGVVDIGPDLVRSISGRHPVRSSNPSGDGIIQCLNSWLGV